MPWIAQEEEGDPRLLQNIFPGSPYSKSHSSSLSCAGKDRNEDLRICLIEESGLIQN